MKSRLIGIFCFFLIVTSGWAQSGAYVLILNSTGIENSWNECFNQEINKLFNQRGDLKFETHLLPVSLMEGEKQASELHKEMLEKYANAPSAAIIVGIPAWVVYAPLFDKEWKNVPVILCSSASRVPSSLQGLLEKTPLTEQNSIPIEELRAHYNLTVLENPVYLDENIRLIRKMQPEMKKLVFISGDSYRDACIRNELAQLIRSYYVDIKLELLTENELSTEQLMDTLYSYGPAAGLLFNSWSKSGGKESLSYAERRFGRNLFASAHTPVFTVSDVEPVSIGWAGGYYISAEDFAMSCMAVLDRILAGERASSIPQAQGGVPGIYLNHSALEWFGINPHLYPSAAFYYNRPAGFFKQYLWPLSIVFFLSGALLIWKYMLGRRHKKRKLLGDYLLRMLDSPVYMLDKNGVILEELTNLHRSYDVLRQKNEKGFSFENLFVDEKEFVRYVRLINFVIWTGKVREKVIHLRDGSDEVRYFFTRIVSCDQDRVLVMMSDISEKERARRESDESRFFLKTVLENLPISVFVKDMKDNRRFTVWNKRLSEVLEYRIPDAKGTGSEALPKRIRQITDLEGVANVSPDSSSISFLRELECKGGKKKILSIYPSLISYRDKKSWLVGSVIDMTEQETRKKELEKLNRRYDLMLRAMGTIPWTWDLQKNRLEYNCTFIPEKYHISKGIVFKTEEEHYNQIVPEQREHLRASLHRLRSGEITLLNETCQVYNAGFEEPLWVESFVVVGQRNAVGIPMELVGTSMIIDERKKMEKELLCSKEKAEEANRMKSAFLANMTHEIRTPLSAITGFSSLLAASNDTPENKEFIQIIENNSRILLKLVNDVLDMSKIESGTLEFLYNEINVNASLADLVSSWKVRVAPGVTIRFNPALDSCMLRTDEVRLLQIMGNYISNAVKHTESGTITVGYYPPNGNYIRFYVQDTGIGIPAEMKSSIFERFVKLNSFKQGTGLGLSICKMIAERMNGRVGVESEEGVGSEFWFEHPYAHAL